jgi:hypothetical protein
VEKVIQFRFKQAQNGRTELPREVGLRDAFRERARQ